MSLINATHYLTDLFTTVTMVLGRVWHRFL